MNENRPNSGAGAVFVTGGAAGIGAAAVRRFAAAGRNVIFVDVDRAAGEALAAELGDSVLFVVADTRRRAELDAAVAAGQERFGAIDTLFANAGIHRRNTMLDVPDEEFDLVVQTNIYGTFNTLKAVVPALKAAGGGAVVLNASDQVFIGKPGNFAYGLTKGAIGQITRSLALELAPFGIRVNAVCPGTVRTPLVDSLFSRVSERTGIPVAELWAEEDALFPLGRSAEASEVAEMVYFLASDAASFCTGGHYLCDGGLVAK